jgi:hypothetical protein
MSVEGKAADGVPLSAVFLVTGNGKKTPGRLARRNN